MFGRFFFYQWIGGLLYDVDKAPKGLDTVFQLNTALKLNYSVLLSTGGLEKWRYTVCMGIENLLLADGWMIWYADKAVNL